MKVLWSLLRSFSSVQFKMVSMCSEKLIVGQYPLLSGPSVCSPQMVWECVRAWVCVSVHWHSAEWTNTWLMWTCQRRNRHFLFIPSTYTHTRTRIHTIRGLRTDGAKSGYCPHMSSTPSLRSFSKVLHIAHSCSYRAAGHCCVTSVLLLWRDLISLFPV